MKDKDSAWFVSRLESLGRSQADLSRYMGVDRAIINRLLSGDQRVTINHIEQLCNYLNEPPSKVLAAFGVDFGDKNKTWLADASDEDDMRNNRVTIEDHDGEVSWSIPSRVAGEAGANSLSACVMVRVIDDNMSPTLHNGDYLIVDKSAYDPRPGIYAINHGGHVLIRRLDPVIGTDLIRVKSDKDAEAHEIKADKLSVFGKVVWRAGKI